MTKVKESNKTHLDSSPFVCYLEKHEHSKRTTFSNFKTLFKTAFVPAFCNLGKAGSKDV